MINIKQTKKWKCSWIKNYYGKLQTFWHIKAHGGKIEFCDLKWSVKFALSVQQIHKQHILIFLGTFKLCSHPEIQILKKFIFLYLILKMLNKDKCLVDAEETPLSLLLTLTLHATANARAWILMSEWTSKPVIYWQGVAPETLPV